MILFAFSPQLPSGEVVFDIVCGKNGKPNTTKPLFFQQNNENIVAIPGNNRLYIVNIAQKTVTSYNYNVTALAFNNTLGIVFSTKEGIFAIGKVGNPAREIVQLFRPVISNLLLMDKKIFFVDSTGTLQRVENDGTINGLEFLLPAQITTEEMLFEAGENFLYVHGSDVLLITPDLKIIKCITLSGNSNKNIIQSGKLYCFIPKYNHLIIIDISPNRLGQAKEFPLNATHFLGLTSETHKLLSMIYNKQEGTTLQISSISDKKKLPEKIFHVSTKNYLLKNYFSNDYMDIQLAGDYILCNYKGNWFAINVHDIPSKRFNSQSKVLKIRESSRLESKFYSKKIGNEEYICFQEGSRFTLIRLKPQGNY
jgi:hypothetical protein